MILNFLCRTSSQENFWEIKRECYVAGADVISEEIKESEFILEVSTFQGFLYKKIKSSNLCDLEIRITGGIKNTEIEKTQE